MAVGMVGGRRFGRYRIGARLYDLLSLEWPVYAAGRRAGIDLLGLQPGQRVLDVGCGTGLNLPLLDAAVGPTGSVAGVDLSGDMLAVATAKVVRHGWRHVSLVQAHAAAIPMVFSPGSFDAVVFTYSLSVIDDSAAAWRSALRMLRPGGRAVVVDLGMPRGGWTPFVPLAWLACASGGARFRREVWRWVDRDLCDVVCRSVRGGHVRVAAGTFIGMAAASG